MLRIFRFLNLEELVSSDLDNLPKLEPDQILMKQLSDDPGAPIPVLLRLSILSSNLPRYGNILRGYNPTENYTR